MSRNAITETLHSTPFRPFRIRVSGGPNYAVHDRHMVALTRSRAFIVMPDLEKWTFVPYAGVEAVEDLNGHGGEMGYGNAAHS